MKKQTILTLLCTLLCTLGLQAGTIIVAADGSGDATSIQAGINLAAARDTVLISPGIWTGAVLIDNKPITIGSYYIADGDTSHISQTIIDGEDTRTGIIIQNCSDTVDTLRVIGLTIRSCRSNWYPNTVDYSIGGGIGIGFSVAKVIKCHIQSNRAFSGGGIGVLRSYVYLYANEIHSNNAIGSGGGLCGLGYNDMYIYFDFDCRNSIYLNNGSRGSDITYASHNTPTTVYLDKGSVDISDPYFYFFPDPMNIHINQSMISQVSHDLWVSPGGDNANSGISAQSPLKNISYALAKIQPVGSIQLTVHIMLGTYSYSQTGEALPLQPKSYVNIVGEEMESVILDAEQYGTFIIGLQAQDYLTIKNLTLVNGYATRNNLFWLDGTSSTDTNIISVENIHIRDSWVKFDAFRILSCHNLTVNNLIIEDSQVGSGFNIFVYETGNFSNFRIQRLSSTNYDMYNSSCTAGAISKPLRATSLQTTVNISNFLITDIIDTSQFWQNVSPGLSIGIEGGNCDLTINNCTIANNSSVTQSGGLNLSIENCNVQVNNTIVSGNSPYEVVTYAFNESNYAGISFSNCLITGGDDSFIHVSGDISHTWVEGNQFGLPSFRGGDTTDPLNYSLASNSPCIDSGTPDLDGLSLPPYDLAGNWRIWNNVIDMGCYEYGSEPWVSNDDPVVPAIAKISLTAYPNPFHAFTNLKVNLPSGQDSGLAAISEASINIYNLKGQKVKTIRLDARSPGEQFTYWDGRNADNVQCSSGIYFINLHVNGRTVSNRKVTFIR
ncbi:MAG: FlgD immunoglobulin-like domain containing protein [Candidatus Cloacimonetes bacterium]|nr:FlgD immunoglobulin-like domain containing protein [Candidatus Cloacimonadota bacterium]